MGSKFNSPHGRVLRGFRVARVFDVSQTEGQALPDFATVTGDPGDRLAKLEDVVRQHGIELNYEPIAAGALGLSHGGWITVLPTLSQPETFSVLVHEFAHELPAASRTPAQGNDAHEAPVKEGTPLAQLYEQIGRLKVELEWLKKECCRRGRMSCRVGWARFARCGKRTGGVAWTRRRHDAIEVRGRLRRARPAER